jgi:hypothetical protein
MTETDLILRAGLPFARRFRVLGATAVWPDLPSFEVRSQVRARKSPDSELKMDLAQFITMSIEGEDIVGDISLTGSETYTLTSGYYDVVLSDPGTTDARLIPVLEGDFKVLPRLVTTPA